jgi:hypothetical protein
VGQSHMHVMHMHIHQTRTTHHIPMQCHAHMQFHTLDRGAPNAQQHTRLTPTSSRTRIRRHAPVPNTGSRAHGHVLDSGRLACPGAGYDSQVVHPGGLHIHLCSRKEWGANEAAPPVLLNLGRATQAGHTEDTTLPRHTGTNAAAEARAAKGRDLSPQCPSPQNPNKRSSYDESACRAVALQKQHVCSHIGSHSKSHTQVAHIPMAPCLQVRHCLVLRIPQQQPQGAVP